jgi:hypothetical protein
MKNWTTQAEQRLEQYLRERAAREGFHGEDAAGLMDDLRSHIYEEARQEGQETIGLMQLETILGRLDAGYRPANDPAAGLPKSRTGGIGRFFLWTFGVVLPAGVLVFEWIATFCGSVFFDPIPTFWHAFLVALVPAINGWLLTGGRGVSERIRGAAAGVALVVALFYALLFLPLIHLSVIALVFLGMGVLSLTPVTAALASWRVGAGAKRGSMDVGAFKTGWRTGALAAALVLFALEGPALWTRVNLTASLAGGEKSESAVARLRAWHSERVLLKACYEGNRGTQMATDISGWILMGWRIPAQTLGVGTPAPLDSATVREVFFRVTGKPFNSLKPPKSHRGGPGMRRGADPLEEIDFDDHTGGDEVAVRLKHLDLAESRFDGHVDSVSRIGYGEWTMVFKNGSSIAKEARCQVRLPRDGRVSRLTLWVNGEPREAAFSTVSKVKAAYKAIAVVQRRDPVLVNVVAPDTVMVQCFPVPAHGQMKIRFGVTAPLDGVRWEMPRIVERNFGLAGELEHALWLQGDCGFDLTGNGKPMAAQRDGDGHSLPATLDGESVMDPGIALVTGALPAEPEIVWCEDRFAKVEERILIREPVTATRKASDKIVLVIDGSFALAGAKDWITKSIGSIPAEGLTVILADDHARIVKLSDLEAYRFSGGRDNEPALREAIRLSKEGGAPIVWIHGPQAIGLSQSEAIQQLLERGTVRPVIHEVEAASGPNRLAESIYRTGCMRRGPALVNPAEDFARFLKEIRMDRREIAWNWKRSAAPDGLTGKKVWDQLARSWAVASVEDPASPLTDAARAELAATYQMVTPFSGAVVLETQQQYDEHGLTPADGDATPKIPNVPEPSSGILILLTITAAMLRRRRAA